MTLEEIRLMTEQKFKNIVRQKSKECAFRYLMKGRGRKGKEIEYDKIEMAEYLQPMNKELTIENRRRIFEIRNMMVGGYYPISHQICPISHLFLAEHVCPNSHIFNCPNSHLF